MKAKEHKQRARAKLSISVARARRRTPLSRRRLRRYVLVAIRRNKHQVRNNVNSFSYLTKSRSRNSLWEQARPKRLEDKKPITGVRKGWANWPVDRRNACKKGAVIFPAVCKQTFIAAEKWRKLSTLSLVRSPMSRLFNRSLARGRVTSVNSVNSVNSNSYQSNFSRLKSL